MEKEEIEFMEEWLSLEKYHFKIITMITVLADNNRAFRGKLKDLCNELGIQFNQGNKSRILTTLNYLTQENYINTIEDKDIYTISLAAAAEKSKKITKIKKALYQLIREAKGNAAWDSVLKTFLIVSELPHNLIITYNEIGKMVSLKETTVKNCIKTICSIDFGDFEIARDKITSHPAVLLIFYISSFIYHQKQNQYIRNQKYIHINIKQICK